MIDGSKMPEFFRNKILLIIALLGLGLAVLLQLSVKPTISDDSPGYIECANFLSHGNVKDCDPARTPGYPLFIMLTDTIFGGLDYQLTVFIQYLLTLGTAYLMYRLALMIFNNRLTGYIAFFLIATNPLFIFYGNNLLSEVPFLFFLTGFAYYVVKYVYDQKNRYLVYSSLLLGAATLVRPSSQYYFVFTLLILAALHHKHWQSLLKKSLLVIAVFFLLITPWILKNSLVYHERSLTVFLGYALWTNVFHGDRLPLVDSNLYRFEKEIIRQKGIQKSYVESWHTLFSLHPDPVAVNQIMKEISVETVKKYPLGYARGSMASFIKLTFYPKYFYGDYLQIDQLENLRSGSPSKYFYYAFKDLMHKVNYPVLLMTILGIIGLGVTFFKSEPRYKIIAVFFALLIFGSLAIPAFFSLPYIRYRTAVDQFLILFASYAVVYLWSRYDLGIRLVEFFAIKGK